MLDEKGIIIEGNVYLIDIVLPVFDLLTHFYRVPSGETL